MKRSSALIGGALAVAFMLSATPAAAWEFDAALGQIKTTGELSWSFEGAPPEGLRVATYNEDFDILPESSLTERFETLEEALEGQGALRIGGSLSLMSIDLRPIAERFAGRRVAVTVWTRSEGTAISGRMTWYAGADLETDEERSYIGSISLNPTGQVTSDGWREYSTGPVDWNAGGAAPLQLAIQDSHLYDAYSGGLAYDLEQTVLLDALEIEDLGEAAASSETCTATTSDAVCGDLAACLWGTCVDSAILTNVVPNDRFKSDYLDRVLTLFQLLEGGELPQSLIPEMGNEFEALKGVSSPHMFWDRLSAAIARLQDGHAGAPQSDFGRTGNGGVCLVMGEADRLPEGGALPMVFSRAEALRLGEQLEVGDVLVEVDGMDPYAWLKAIPTAPTHAGDPVVAEYILTPDLIGKAMRAGSVMTFARCSNMERACTAEEVETVTLDFKALLAEDRDIWTDPRPDWTTANVPCDWRFARHVQTSPNQAARYFYAGASDRDGLAYLLINGTPDPDWRDGDWRAAIEGGLEADEVRGVLLDHRQGGGGTVTGVNLIAGYMLDPEGGFGHIDWFPYVPDFTKEVYETFRTCQRDTFSSTGCGGAYYWDIFEQHPSPGLQKDKPLAIVIGQDVSGNDFLTEVLRYRTAPTRIFGSPATYGAFGTVIGLPGLLGEFSGGSVQVSDSMFFAEPWEFGSDAELPRFTTGLGVPPDEPLLQRQSDAMMGVDTVLTRAEAWLEEVQP